MNPDNNPQALARDGLRQIEDSILRLLAANPEGLRNVDIARGLALRSDFPGRQRDFLTYSVLGGLLSQGKVLWDSETKLFTLRYPYSTAEELAQAGLGQIENAILQLLDANPGGLRNVEIADALDLRSDFRGRQQNYLTYSILGGLVGQGRVNWDAETRLFTKA